MNDNLTPRLLERMLLERDLVDTREIKIPTKDGTEVAFSLKTLTSEQKTEIKARWDATFPVPPVKTVQTPVGSMARFDLENPDYHERLSKWHQGLQRDFLAATLGITAEEFASIEELFPDGVLSPLFGTAELINGIQSEPLMELVKEAIWAPEVLTWLETYKGKPDDLKISDTPLFREIECVVAAGLTLEQWGKLPARQKLLYITWHDAKSFREAYVNWSTMPKTEGSNRHIK
jgi:hypothetical protein